MEAKNKICKCSNKNTEISFEHISLANPKTQTKIFSFTNRKILQVLNKNDHL